MEAFVLYLLKSVIWLTGFAFIYFMFLRNERYFRLKRYYLLAGILISFIFPLFTFHYRVEIPAPEMTYQGIVPSYPGATSSVQQGTESKSFDINYVFLLLYLTGILFFVFKSVRNTNMLLTAIKKTKIDSFDKIKLVRTHEFSSSFSFFNYVFINPSIDKRELDVIMNHELVHINEKHWLDLILIEMLRLVQWVNPFVWLYSRFIKINHEYIADEVVLQQTPNSAVYKAVLVNQLFDSRVISLTNSFNYSLNKQRFDMMKKMVTSPYRKMKVLLVMPVFAIVFYAFATPEYQYNAPADHAKNIVQAEPSFTDAIQDQKKSKVKIRNSDGSKTNPLVVIDGVKSKKGVEEIDPSTIASITVLKDESATNKYGKEGKDGVIEITTINKASGMLSVVTQNPVNQKAVKGIVLKEDGQPLENVNIMSTGASGNANSITTGKDGRFELINIQPDASLLFFCQGYKGLTLKADFTKEMSVKMVKDPDFKGTQVTRQTPLVVIDGEITDKNYMNARTELGYDLAIVKQIFGKEATDKYGEKGANGVMELTTRKKALEMGLKPEMFPRLTPDDYPTFQNQYWASFKEWVIDNVKYPAEATAQKIEGWVWINFAVELDGSISNVVAFGAANPVLSNEVIRVIKSAPKWDPPKNPAVDMPFSSSVNIGFKLPDQIVKEEPFVVVEEMPMYPGGEGELLKFIAENTKYPEAAKAEKIQGKVIVRFIVNTDGNTEGMSVLKGVHPLLDAEAVRVVGLLTGFKPGMQGGKAVPVWYMVPINFALPVTKQP
jgi:TonB family protein